MAQDYSNMDIAAFHNERSSSPIRPGSTTMSEQQPPLLTKTKLKERGWTDTLIEKFLPHPDETQTNPIYTSSSPMRLYRLERVEQMEASKDFIASQSRTAARKRAAQKGIETKRRKLMQYIDTLHFPVLPLASTEELIDIACSNYNRRQRGKEIRDQERWGTPSYYSRMDDNSAAVC
jgi:hypothetical protein